jgi:hypothetical protein
MRLTSFSGKGGVKFSKKVKIFLEREFYGAAKAIRGTPDYADVADIRNIDF